MKNGHFLSDQKDQRRFLSSGQEKADLISEPRMLEAISALLAGNEQLLMIEFKQNSRARNSAAQRGATKTSVAKNIGKKA